MKARFLGTHDGSFHADEVTAAALLIVFDCIDPHHIIRSRKESELTPCEYVCDVGGIYDPSLKRFDHHQVGYAGELSSAGMILLHLLETNVIDQKTFTFLKDSFVQGVDDHDNGRSTFEVGVSTFSHVISQFVPPSYQVSSHEMKEAFDQAVAFTVGHIRRLLSRYHYIKACENRVHHVMKKGHDVLIFDEAMPWMDIFFENGGESHPALFVIMPADSHWKLRGIPPHTLDRMNVRKPLPLAWSGLMGEALKEISQIEGAIFCHKGRFISIWETKEDAMKALQEVLK
ncbi:MYG1 family protein [Rhabdochlamydiaceae symbiont of Dictyostelium giganteum]|uniref:MYG1 family protein n=1 Tax=Rhabdochlamydiaceae symbiont of Dictyostelium giganteum TaxID=3342349 RepID=UPI00384B81F7